MMGGVVEVGLAEVGLAVVGLASLAPGTGREGVRWLGGAITSIGTPRYRDRYLPAAPLTHDPTNTP